MKTKKFNGETFKLFSDHGAKMQAELDYAVAKHRGKKARITKKVIKGKVQYEVWIRG